MDVQGAIGFLKAELRKLDTAIGSTEALREGLAVKREKFAKKAARKPASNAQRVRSARWGLTDLPRDWQMTPDNVSIIGSRIRVLSRPGRQPMLTDYDVEGILRDDLQLARRRVQQSLASFLRIADQEGGGAPERLDQAATDHSAARDQVIAVIHRWNQFCLLGTVPEDLAVKTKGTGSA